MRQASARVVAREAIGPATYILRLEASWLAQAARPGQFVHVRCGEGRDPLLRRPISVHRVGKGTGTDLRTDLTPGPSPTRGGEKGVPATNPGCRVPPSPAGKGDRGLGPSQPHPRPLPDAGRGDEVQRSPFPRGEGGQGVRFVPAPSPAGKGDRGLGPSSDRGLGSSSPATSLRPGEVSLLFGVVGRGTEWLARRQPGDELDVLGPLGRGYSVAPTSRRLLLVAGGVGVAPLVMLADEAVAKGLTVTLAMGAATAAAVYPSRLLPPEVECLVATEDGSLGREGLVTDLLAEPLAWADQVFACGPRGMIAALRRLPRRPGAAPIQVSLEERMGCGVGVCFGCVVETRQGLERVCQDGPVFTLDELAE